MLDTPIDGGVWLDPYLLSVGYLILTVALLLSQNIRDGTFPLADDNGWIFWIARKVGVMGFILTSIVGFFVIGWLWLIVATAIWLLSGIVIRKVPFFQDPMRQYYCILIAGLSLTAWAQTPTLGEWGL